MKTTTTSQHHLKEHVLSLQKRHSIPFHDRVTLFIHQEIYNKTLSKGQKPYLEFYACDKPAQIGADAHKHMDTYILYAFEPQIIKSMTTLKDTKESLNGCPELIELLEALCGSNSLQYFLNSVVLLKIKGWSVFAFITFLFKKTTFSFLCMKSAAKLEPFSQGLLSPITEFYACLAKKPPLRTYYYIFPLNGIFPCPWIWGNKGSDIVIKQIRAILSRVIGSICNHTINLFVLISYDGNGLISQLRQEFTIPFIARCNLHCCRDWKLCINNFHMNLISKEAEVFALITPGCLIIRPEGLNMRRVNGELKVFIINKADRLGYEIGHDFTEDFFSESLSEIMECIVCRGLPVGEPAEVSQSSIVTELMSELSFRGSKTEVYKEECLEEGLGVISLATFIAITVFDKVVEEGKINGFEQYLQGIIRWDERGDFKVNETELSGCSHRRTSIWN